MSESEQPDGGRLFAATEQYLELGMGYLLGCWATWAMLEVDKASKPDGQAGEEEDSGEAQTGCPIGRTRTVPVNALKGQLESEIAIASTSRGFVKWESLDCSTVFSRRGAQYSIQ